MKTSQNLSTLSAFGSTSTIDLSSREDIVMSDVKEESKSYEPVNFMVIKNDEAYESMILLTGLKNIFQRQLPKMPKEYISRLAYDRNHVAMAVVRDPLFVLGGITIRPFAQRGFAEIVFCAVASSEQVKGYGSKLMTNLKDFVKEEFGIQHFLTYADNYAIGYFKKQGFTTDITLERSIWMGYIKDYEGGTLMQCTMIPKVTYLKTKEIILAHRKAVYQKVQSLTHSHIVYPGLVFEKGKPIDPRNIPGLKEAGWTPEMAQLALINQSKKHGPLYPMLKKLVTELQDHGSAWPFENPVAGVPDYYEVIKEPMDIKTLNEKVEEDAFDSVAHFATDTQKIFNNCRTYNESGTPYTKCANKLEKFFNERLQVLKLEFGLK